MFRLIQPQKCSRKILLLNNAFLRSNNNNLKISSSTTAVVLAYTDWTAFPQSAQSCNVRHKLTPLFSCGYEPPSHHHSCAAIIAFPHDIIQNRRFYSTQPPHQQQQSPVPPPLEFTRQSSSSSSSNKKAHDDTEQSSSVDSSSLSTPSSSSTTSSTTPSTTPSASRQSNSLSSSVHKQKPADFLHTSKGIPSGQSGKSVSSSSTSSVSSASSSAVSSSSSPSSSPVKVSLWTRVKTEALHYYHGFRLFVLDVRVALGLLNHLTKGESLTRRERKQLVRTMSDILRIVPFAVLIIVPFMELLIPFYIRLFPFMMPSSFQQQQTGDTATEQRRKRLKIKLEMARYLQETLQQAAATSPSNAASSLQSKSGGGGVGGSTTAGGRLDEEEPLSVADFHRFMDKARSSGRLVDTHDLLRFSRLFEDELTLENLSIQQLRALSGLLDLPSATTNIAAFAGASRLLRFQLRLRLRQLKVDDQLIRKEQRAYREQRDAEKAEAARVDKAAREAAGTAVEEEQEDNVTTFSASSSSSSDLEFLPVWELQQLCRERGMRAIGVSESRLRFQLNQWLSLHVDHGVPLALLLLTRISYLPDSLTPEEQLKQVILQLPRATEHKVAAESASELDGEQLEKQLEKKEEVHHEAERVKEKELEEKAREKEKRDKAAEERRMAVDDVKAKRRIVEEEQREIERERKHQQQQEKEKKAAAAVTASSTGRGGEISSSDMEQIETAIESMSESQTALDELELEHLKKERREEQLEKERARKPEQFVRQQQEVELEEKLEAEKQPEKKQERRGRSRRVAERLSRKVDSMIEEIDELVDDLKGEQQKRLQKEKPEHAHEHAHTQTQNVGGVTTQVVDRQRLMQALRNVQQVTEDEQRWEQILEVLDEDQDGLIEMKHVVRAMQQLGHEKTLQLSAEEMRRLLDMVDKEERIELENDKQLQQQQRRDDQ